MIMDNRKEIVGKMIDALNDRGGFDDWWHNIDEEIQDEITDELVNILPIQIISNRTWIVTIECGDITEDWKITAPNKLAAKATASSNYNGKTFNILRCVEYGC